MSGNGLTTIQSHGSVKATMDSLEANLRKSGISVFARVDQVAV